MVNTGFSLVTRNETWAPLSFPTEIVSNNLEYWRTTSSGVVETVLKMFCQGIVNLDIMHRPRSDGPHTSRNLHGHLLFTKQWMVIPVKLFKITVRSLIVFTCAPGLKTR